MAYRRRYFEPFVGTTETIGDKAITGDKIDEGAVGTGKLADDAVISEKIKDETIRSEDLKDGEVKTADLGLGAVTSSKLADNAVTTYKYAYQSITGSKIKPGTITTDLLAEAPITRPITPGVTTAEIGDGQVTASKLSGNAVETVAVKDRAITGIKIDTDTITSANIAANAITGAEIAAGAVGTDELSTAAVTPEKIDSIDAPADGESLIYDEASGAFEWTPDVGVSKHIDLTDKEVAGVIDHADSSVTALKLATDAVETAKIKDANVTEPKLETDFLRKYLEGRQVFYDDFLGAVLDNLWAQSGTAGGNAVIVDRSKVSITTKAEAAAVYRINWNGKLGVYIGKLPKFYAKFWASNATEADFKVFVGLRKDAVQPGFFLPGVPMSITLMWSLPARSSFTLTGL
ncbi:hypothetical protein ES703_58584 [subsurface metagenome]